ncbi:hypothetical protein [Chitinolyticbacter albus]|uniref:hypothetical protein n=1 Tax=Chitinolyticbacter albus TaxID=2961951 RepID=UPI0021097916|nr:hypothetical protein [Chitinolyticbacter albus]
MKLEELTYEQLRSLVDAATSQHIFEVFDEVFLAEANVFICKRRGKRFNLKYDIDYGLSLEPVDRHTADELTELTAVLTGMLPP